MLICGLFIGRYYVCFLIMMFVIQMEVSSNESSSDKLNCHCSSMFFVIKVRVIN